MKDRFNGVGIGHASGPFLSGFPITPDDAQPLQENCRGIWVGTTGNLRVMFRNDPTQTPVILLNVPGGMKLDIWINQVFFTGTTATNLVGLV